MIIPKDAITAEDLARRLNVTMATLRRWHQRGKGPKRSYDGRFPYYRVSDIEAWKREEIRRLTE
jgi:DNA-binding transcriptional MerR regulator